MYYSDVYKQVTFILQDVPPLGASLRQTREGGKTSYFRAKYVNISKTVRYTSIVTFNDCWI